MKKDKKIKETAREQKSTGERLVLKHEVDIDDDAVIDAYFRESTGTLGWDLIFYRRTHGHKEYILKLPANAFDKKSWIPFTGDLPANGRMSIPYRFGTRLFRHFKKDEEAWKEKYYALAAHLKDMQQVMEIFIKAAKKPGGNPVNESSEFRREQSD